MYNHYIPQSDGSYRRSNIPEQQRQSRRSAPIPSPAPSPRPEPAPEEPPCPASSPPASPVCAPAQNVPEQHGTGGILSFLKGLLPRQIDTDDLLIILLIFLMNREEDCDGLSPMLTLALYFLL